MTAAKPSKVLLIGFGGVGTMVSYTLEHLGRAEVTVVSVPETYESIIAGYNIESLSYGNIDRYVPTNVAQSPREAVEKYGPFEYIVITTKNIPDVSPVVDMIKDCYSDDSTIVLIQNGIGIEIPIYRKYPHATIMSGVTIIGTTLYDNTVKHVQTDTMRFGPYINYNLPKDVQIAKCKKFCEMYSNPGNVTEYEEDVKFTRWRKLVYNACINTTCALADIDAGRADIYGGMETIIKPAMREVIAVAESEGVKLDDDVIEIMCRGEDGVYYPPSMLIDVRRKGFIEHINIIGNVVKYANRNGVPIPTLTVLNNLLKLVQLRTMEARGLFTLPKIRPLPEEHYKIQFTHSREDE